MVVGKIRSLFALGSEYGSGCRAEIACRGQRRVVDVLWVDDLIAIAVRVKEPPGARDELHRSNRSVECRIAVEDSTVGVSDECESRDAVGFLCAAGGAGLIAGTAT